MNKAEASLVSGSKPVYEAPVVVDLTKLTQGRGGFCGTGSGNSTCMTGSAAGSSCEMGSSGG